MSTLRQMQIFISIVEKGSFISAANALDISSAAVSKQMSQLEGKCQQTLFDRSTRAIGITDFGREYYQVCKKVISSIAEADSLVESQSYQLRGNLHLHAPPFVIAHLILPLLNKFMTEHPLLNVRVSTSDTIPNVLEGEVDLLIGYNTELVGARQNLRCCKLFESENVLAASPLYIEKHGMPKHRQDLYRHRFIQELHLPQPLSLKFLDGEVVQGLNTVLALGDRRLMCLATLQHMGVIYTSKGSILPELVSGNLVEILPNSLSGKTIFAAFYKHSSLDSVKVQRFLQALKATVKLRDVAIHKLARSKLYTNPYA